MKITTFAVLASAALITAPVFGQVLGLGVQTQLGGRTAGQLSSGGTLNGGLNSAVRGGTAAALNTSAGGTDSSIGTMAVGGLADSSSARATGTTPGSSASDANASSSGGASLDAARSKNHWGRYSIGARGNGGTQTHAVARVSEQAVGHASDTATAKVQMVEQTQQQIQARASEEAHADRHAKAKADERTKAATKVSEQVGAQASAGTSAGEKRWAAATSTDGAAALAVAR